jgi:hypothetical protein
MPTPELSFADLRSLQIMAEDQYYSYQRLATRIFNSVSVDLPLAKYNSVLLQRDHFLTLRDKLTTIIERKDTSRKLGTQS